MTLNYFYRTPAKDWDVLEALIIYDKEVGGNPSFEQVLVNLKQDLKIVGKTQTSLNRYVLKALNQVDKLLSLRCLKETATEQQQPININTISQNDQVNVAAGDTVIINQPGNKRRICNEVMDTDIAEGSCAYNFKSPSAPVEHPYKPKLRKVQAEALSQLIHFGISSTQTTPITKALYVQYKNDQRNNTSLKSLSLFDYIAHLLEDDAPYDSFPELLWSSKLADKQTDRTLAFFNIVKYTLTSFHLSCKSPPMNITNHERTHFVENIIPSLLALGKSFNFIEFKWCESEFVSTKLLNLKDSDYDLRAAPPSKNIDALGTLTTNNNMELIVVEASSGQQKENTTHSIEDTLKILECVYGIHVIKSQITLSEISLHDETHWRCIELRTAKLPTVWSDRIIFIQYLELLATLHDACLNNQIIQNQLAKENIGVTAYDGPSVGSVIKL